MIAFLKSLSSSTNFEFNTSFKQSFSFTDITKSYISNARNNCLKAMDIYNI